MLTVKLWFRLSEDAQNRIRLYQKEHQPRWQPPSDKMSQSVPAVRVQDDGGQLHPDIVPRIMQATPEQVKHGRGVFGGGNEISR
jgi:hypothetical protein